MNMIAQRFRTITVLSLCAIIFLVLSAFLYWYAPEQGHYDVDSAGYDAIATHYAKTGILADPQKIGSAPIQTTGYPLCVGLLYQDFGHSIPLVIFLQIILACVSLLLLYRIARLAIHKTVGLIACLLATCTVGWYVYPQFLLAETVLVFVLLLFFERFFAYMRSKDLRYDLQLAAALLALSVLIKPCALLYALCVIPVIWRVADPGKKLLSVFVFTLIFYGIVGAYMLRNYIEYNRFALAPMTELNIYQCYFSKVLSRLEHKPEAEVIEEKLRFSGIHSFDSAGWGNAKTLFFATVKQHPALFLQVWMVNVGKTLFGLYSTQLKLLFDPHLRGGHCSFFKTSGTIFERLWAYIVGGTQSNVIKAIAIFEVLFSLFRWIFAFIGIYVLYRRREYTLLWIFGSFIVQAALITGIDGCCRYRIVFESMLIILCAIGIYAVYRYLHISRGPRKKMF